MEISLYGKSAKFIKRIFGIKDFSLFQKNLKKNIGKYFYRKKYSADDIVEIMKTLGMKEGSLVCIHSSMKEFYNYEGTAEELIDKILIAIGESGTLMMPCFPDVSYYNESYIFDALNDKTGAGHLSEVFRKYPKVRRSLNVQSSACALGPLSDYLCGEHHNSKDSWDELSPWYRSCEKGCLVFNLGMPHNYIGTFEHCVESILQYEHPYWAQFFTKERIDRFYDANFEIRYQKTMTSAIERRPYEPIIFKWLSQNDWRFTKLSNLKIKVFYSKNCLNKMLNLGRVGISLYWIPSVKRHIF